MKESIKVEATDMDIKEEMCVITVEGDTFLDIKEEKISIVKFEGEMLVGAKEEDFCGDVNSPTVKAEQDQVSYICVCTLLDTFYEYPVLCSITYCVDLCWSVCEQVKQLHCSEWKHFCEDLNPRSSSICPSHCMTVLPCNDTMLIQKSILQKLN